MLRPVHSVVPKVLLLTILVANASSFIVAPASHPHRVDVRSKQTTTTQLHGNTKQPPALFPPIQDISYGEESRQYRRTVFSHDDWRRHRSQNRFVKNLRSLTASGIYKNLARELFVVTGIATFLCVYNGLVGGGYMDFAGVQHAALISSPWLPVLGLPQAPFSLLSSSLSLLLGRWDLFMHVCVCGCLILI